MDRHFLFFFQNDGALFVRQFLIEPLEQPAFGFIGAQAADLMESLALHIEQIIEFGLATVRVFHFFRKFALVVLDHLLLLLKLVGTSFQQILLFIEVPLALERFLASFIKLLLDT